MTPQMHQDIIRSVDWDRVSRMTDEAIAEDIARDPDAMAQDTRARNRDAVNAMGFELEESRVPFEVIVIERAEKPAEN